MCEADAEELTHVLTRERLRSYLAVAHDEAAALQLYDWNVRASAEVLAMIGMVEIVVRNSLDRELQRWARRRDEAADWFGVVSLDSNGSSDLAVARRRASRSGPAPHGKMVAELNLGFWRYLVARKYLTSLWIPTTHRAFEHGPRDVRVRQREVERRLANLLLVRNRAAHHEPIHRRDLAKDHRDAVALASWVSPAAGAWVERQSRLAAVSLSRPAAESPRQSD